MKRSEINKAILEAKDFLNEFKFELPPFAYWTKEDWENISEDYRELIDNRLGWDVTDYGSGEFDRQGLLLFTLRNGNLDNKTYKKTYAEKIMVVKENQITPYHYHWQKIEDIINRGGGNLVLKLYKADENDKFSNENFDVSIDGKRLSCEPGCEIVLRPGQSITLEPYIYHQFWGEKAHGQVLVGEVSATNDDDKDNKFYRELNRFSEVIEDEPRVTYLVNEYDELFRK